jgi:DNA-binding response OmpR family regulator
MADGILSSRRRESVGATDFALKPIPRRALCARVSALLHVSSRLAEGAFLGEVRALRSNAREAVSALR